MSALKKLHTNELCSVGCQWLLEFCGIYKLCPRFFKSCVNDESESAIQGVAQVCETTHSKEPWCSSKETAADLRQERVWTIQTQSKKYGLGGGKLYIN